jgi:general bacterial porin, GBP family
MKKSLLALAAALATTAYAQSNVEVYGLVDLGVSSVKETVNISEISVQTKTNQTGSEGTHSASRLGFRGTEDIGGGLKASFVLETGLNAGLADRLANLSLASDLGTVTIGKFWNAFDDILTGDGLGATIVGLSPRDTKTTNGISYTSPEVSGFTFGLTVGQDKRTVGGEQDKNIRTQQLSVAYGNGPLTVLAAYGTDKAKYVTEDDILLDGKLSGSAFKVSYDLGVAVPYFIYSKDKLSGSFEVDLLEITADGSIKNAGYEIGASFPMGTVTPYVTYARGNNTFALEGESAFKAKTTGYQVGVLYDLSKRTQLYAVVGSKKTKAVGQTVLKTSQTAFGMVHSF